MNEMQKLEIMNDSWIAWTSVCNELKEIGVDINTQDWLNSALVRWGEAIAKLRSAQLEERRKNAN